MRRYTTHGCYTSFAAAPATPTTGGIRGGRGSTDFLGAAVDVFDDNHDRSILNGEYILSYTIKDKKIKNIFYLH